MLDRFDCDRTDQHWSARETLRTLEEVELYLMLYADLICERTDRH